jgi:hypothetical protein
VTNLVDILNFNDKTVTSLEEQFKAYLTSDQHSVDIHASLTELKNLTDKITPALILPSTAQAYPDQQLLLTQALVQLITTHGMNSDGTQVNQRAIMLLKTPLVMKLAYKNNHALIYEINRVVRDRKAVAESAVLQKKILEKLKAQFTQEADLTSAVRSVESFLFYLDHPSEEEGMERALTDLMEGFDALLSASNQDPLDLLRWMNQEFIKSNQARWYFLKTWYLHTKNQGILSIENQLLLPLQKKENTKEIIEDFQLVDKAFLQGEAKTRWQAVGMQVGGFAFGMELGMVVLENLALMSSLGAWLVLLASLAACVVLGTCIAKFFFSAHVVELEKLNKLSYFEKSMKTVHPEPAAPPSRGWGKTIALIGTLEEGAAAGTLLLTLGAFMLLDLPTWGVAKGNYNSSLPGLFFAQSSPHVALTVLSFALLFTFSAVVSYCLYSGHRALDAPNTVEYYEKQAVEAEMRNVITPESETEEPLFFSWRLWAHHKVDRCVESAQVLAKSHFSPLALG